MSVVDLNQLPDTARLWIYAAERELTQSEVEQLKQKMQVFVQQWTAHKRELRTAWQLQYNRFIIMAVDESMMAASGCSIDSMIRNLRAFEQEIDCQLVGTAAKVFYRDKSGSIEVVSRHDFKQLFTNGIVDEDTIVFNNTIQTLGELRAGKWETVMRQSWHWQAFASEKQQV